MARKRARATSTESPTLPVAGGGRHPGWILAGGAILTVVWLLAFMKPVMDTDLWWQMAYARQMLENHTLIPDHTAFSWSPTDGGMIYCAWLMELLLYGLYLLGGLPLLFALLYLIFGVFLLLLLQGAHRHGVLGHPLTWFIAVLALLMSSSGAIVKPNIASLFFMYLTVWTWLRIKRDDESAWRWAYLLPVLMLLWVNSHGGFVIGLGFMGIMVVGELLNLRFSPDLGLPKRTRQHVVFALCLTGLAVLINPYGWNLPLQLLTALFTGGTRNAAFSAVREYDSIFAVNQAGKPHVVYWSLGIAVLVLLLVPSILRRRIDWALVVLNLVFAALFALYVRLMIFWVPILAFSVARLLGERPGWLFPRRVGVARAAGVAILLSGSVLGGQMIWQNLTRPDMGNWLGFGNSYWNPEEEVAYIGEHFRDARIGNDYTTGSYLLWKLGPRTKVFMDARAFPYFSWFPEYQRLESTVGIADLLKKYPADVWLIQHTFSRTIAWFIASPDWVPAFYGASAAVFVRKGTPLPGGMLQSGKEIGNIRNLYQAIHVLTFALEKHDIAGAERVVAGIRERFGISGSERMLVAHSDAVLAGVKAYWRRDYASALTNLSQSVGTFSGIYQVMLVESALQLMARAWHGNDFQRALDMAYVATKYAPNDPIPRYNTGAIKWWLRGDVTAAGGAGGVSTWRQDFEAFFKLLPNNKGVNPQVVEIAKSILEGRATERPLLAVQPEPQLPGGAK